MIPFSLRRSSPFFNIILLVTACILVSRLSLLISNKSGFWIFIIFFHIYDAINVIYTLNGIINTFKLFLKYIQNNCIGSVLLKSLLLSTLILISFKLFSVLLLLDGSNLHTPEFYSPTVQKSWLFNCFHQNNLYNL